MAGTSTFPTPRRPRPRLRGLTLREALVPTVPMLEGPCDPGNPCAGDVTGRRVPRSHGPAEESANGTKVNIRLPSRPAPVPLERLPGAGIPPGRGRCPGARRAGGAILTGAGLPPGPGRWPTAPRAGCAIVERCVRALPSGDRSSSPTARRAGCAIVERGARLMPSGDRSSSGKTKDRSRSSAAARC